MPSPTPSPQPAVSPDDDRERLAQLFEQAPSLMAMLREPEHRIVLANRAFLRVAGDPDAVGKRVAEVLPPALADEAVKALDLAWSGGAAVRKGDVRWPVANPSAPGGVEERILDLVLQPVHAPVDGAVMGVFVEGTDVTQRVRAEARLKESFAIQTVGIIYWGVGFGLTEVNDAFLRMTGFSREEALGKTWQELTPPEYVAASERAVKQVNTVGEAVPYEKEYYGKDGRRWWGLFAPRRVSPDEVVEFVLDITERKRAEAELRNAEERYRLAARATNDAIWDWDLRTGQVHRNEAVETLFGYRPEETTDGNDWWQDRLHPEDRARVMASLAGAIAGDGEDWGQEYRFRRRDGTYAVVLDRGALQRDEDGRALRFVGAMHDLTPHKESEAQLRQLNETLEGRVLEEVAARMRTEEALRQSQKLEAIGQLTGGVAHDFNNLLTVIRGAADMLRRPSLPEERRARYVEAISETADRAAKLTGQLLAFSRRQALKPEVFDVGGRIESIADMLRTLVGSRVTLTTDTGCDICFVEADPSQFETALVNMAVNARDAMDGIGALSIAVKPADRVPRVRGHGAAGGDFVAVQVTDTGGGIPPDVLARIFEPFFTTKDVGRGTGLGLSQVYGFAKQSGGEVDVRSEPGAGATFTLYLPRVSPAAGGATVESGAAGETQGRGHVLLVEDNEQVGAFSTQILAEMGFETTWAPNADAALKRLDENPGLYAAVFSDVVMPGMNGVELGHEIRRREPGLPVILTSGYSHVLAQEGTHGFELLHKPYSVEDLTRVLRRAIGERAG